jgi:dTDP-4-amino-4,6-dideoxygalactose transaminase
MVNELGLPRVPRLPVLGWNSIALRARRPGLAAVSDARDFKFVSSGRAAIFLALEALGVRRGDRILVPTYHCPTMIAPVVLLGATPVFYPIEPTAAPNLDWLHAADMSGIKALLAAHFFGLPQPLAEVRRFCAERGIALIEDCAHAFFGASRGTPVGSFGDLAIASLPKFFAVVEGGCLIGSADALKRVRIDAPSAMVEVRALLDSVEVGATHGRFGLAGQLFNVLVSLKRRLRRSGSSAPSAGDERSDGDPAKWLDESVLRQRATAATRWIVQHSQTSALVARRRANYMLWVKAVDGIPGAEPLFPQLPEAAAPYVFPLRVRDPEVKYQALRAHGVPVFRWDIVWPDMPVIPADVGMDWQREVLQLGCHQDLSESDIARLAVGVRRLLSD